MHLIEENASDYILEDAFRESLDEVIQDKVDAEIKTMLAGEAVRNYISDLIDEKVKLYFQDFKIKEHHKGPGRGKVGRTSRKFSASLPQELFEEVKSLPGLFSSHLDASLRLYLKMTKR